MWGGRLSRRLETAKRPLRGLAAPLYASPPGL